MFNWLLLLLFYLPFQIALTPWSGVDLASLRVFILLLFGACLIKYRESDFRRFINLPTICLLLFLLLSGFSVLRAENFLWGFRKFLFFLSVFPLYFLVVQTNFYANYKRLQKAHRRIIKIVWILAISSGLAALIGLVQFLAQFIFGLEKVYNFWALNIVPVFSGFNYGSLILAYPSWLVNIYGQTIMRAFSLFSDPHMFSFYLGLILPLLIILPGNSQNNKRLARLGKIYVSGKRRPIFYGLYCLLFIGLILTFTRGAYLAMVAAFLVLSWLLWRYLDRKTTALLLCLSLLIFIIPKTPISSRFYSAFDLKEGSNIGRLEMWQKASQLGLKYPWLGLGLGNYSLNINPNFGYHNPATAHNLYLDIFSEMGVFALAIWLILVFGTIGKLFKIARDAVNIDAKHRQMAMGLIGSLTYLSVHSFFETAIYHPVVLSVLMVVLGLSSIIIKYDSKLHNI